jgi:uncharacterized iron-regulated membrane protein
MRKYHRWISTVFMVLAFYLAVTGSVLAIDELVDPATFAEPATGPPAPAPLPSADALVTMSATVVRAALAASPDATLHALRIQFDTRNAKVRGVVTLAGDAPRTLAFDAGTGAPLSLNAGEREDARSLNDLLQELHSGALVGRGAQWFILATGASFIVLSFTGIWMFFQLLNGRRKAGKRDWFWSARG